MNDMTEAASEAINVPGATQPTSPPAPRSQAPHAAAQSVGAQAVPGATTWGSSATTSASHTENSTPQEDTDGSTATSKVRWCATLSPLMPWICAQGYDVGVCSCALLYPLAGAV